MDRPFTTDEEFLRSSEGEKLARRLVELMLSRATRRDPVGATPQRQFAELVQEYMEYLEQFIRRPLAEPEEKALSERLHEVYWTRFDAQRPRDEPALVKFLLILTRIVPWLAALTAEVWSAEPTVGEREVKPRHLSAAREALGWWVAGLNTLDYHLMIRRIGPRRGIRKALCDATSAEERARLAALFNGPVEVQDGCPLC